MVCNTGANDVATCQITDEKPISCRWPRNDYQLITSQLGLLSQPRYAIASRIGKEGKNYSNNRMCSISGISEPADTRHHSVF